MANGEKIKRCRHGSRIGPDSEFCAICGKEVGPPAGQQSVSAFWREAITSSPGMMNDIAELQKKLDL